MVRPRLSPCSTRASTDHQCPSNCAASSGRPDFNASRICVEEILLVIAGEHGREDLDAEAFHFAHVGKHRRVARPALAELEIAADDNAACAQPIDQHVHDKFLRALRRHLGIESEREHRIDALLGKETRLGAERREAKRFAAGPKKFLRMRLEGEHGQRGATLFGNAFGIRDQRLMAAMHAVEIADGHDRAAIGRGNVAIVAKDAHGAGSGLGCAQAA